MECSWNLINIIYQKRTEVGEKYHETFPVRKGKLKEKALVFFLS